MLFNIVDEQTINILNVLDIIRTMNLPIDIDLTSYVISLGFLFEGKIKINFIVSSEFRNQITII